MSPHENSDHPEAQSSGGQPIAEYDKSYVPQPAPIDHGPAVSDIVRNTHPPDPRTGR